MSQTKAKKSAKKRVKTAEVKHFHKNNNINPYVYDTSLVSDPLEFKINGQALKGKECAEGLEPANIKFENFLKINS